MEGQGPDGKVTVKRLVTANRVLLRAIAREKKVRHTWREAEVELSEAKRHVKLLVESLRPEIRFGEELL
jgi:hypothetical protein